MTPQKAPEQNRLDHILPRSYLRGFAIPNTTDRLNVFKFETRKWFETSPGSVGGENGFYDYSSGAAPDATADQAFAELETNFPIVRQELLEQGLGNWTRHRDFLVRYADMLRARSRLYREDTFKDLQTKTFHKIDEIENVPNPDTGEMQSKIRYSLFTPKNGQEEQDLFKNMSITRMREEIKKAPGLFAEWHWCLQFTADVTDPFIVADNLAVSLTGPEPATPAEAVNLPQTQLIFPLCWQICLIGRKQNFEEETGPIDRVLLHDLQHQCLRDGHSRFAYSPHQLTV